MDEQKLMGAGQKRAWGKFLAMGVFKIEWCMLLILAGNSEIGAQGTVTNIQIFFLRKTFFFIHAQHVLSYHIIQVP